MNNNITFLISHVPDPRFNKRLRIAKKVLPTNLVYWNRNTIDLWDIRVEDINNIELKIKANYTNPLKRLIPTVKFLLKALKKLIKLKPNIIYTGNIDMLLITYLYKSFFNSNVKIMYEIADLHEMLIKEKSLISRSLRSLEKLMLKDVMTLILTSHKFYENYYRKIGWNKSYLFIPNLPNPIFFEGYQKKTEGKFTVGFIGAIRYENQMKNLIAATESSSIELFFAGSGLNNLIKNISQEKEHVTYYGKYDYEKEISSLYGKVDCIYAVYDSKKNNVKIALPNKLYEAIYCELPIIVAKDTYLSELVEEWGIGVSVSSDNLLELEKVINQLSSDGELYTKLVDNCIKIKNKIISEQYLQQLEREIQLLNFTEDNL